MNKRYVKTIAGELYTLYGTFDKKKDALRNAKHMRYQGWHVRIVKDNKTGFWDLWERE
jgi:hypothetical protein